MVTAPRAMPRGGSCRTVSPPNGFRASIIRQYEKGAPLTGTHKSSWFRATEIRRQIVTYYGHPKDIGNPGWKKGGPLPVQLSSFRAERTEQGALIQWTTESELEKCGVQRPPERDEDRDVHPRHASDATRRRDDLRAEQVRRMWIRLPRRTLRITIGWRRSRFRGCSNPLRPVGCADMSLREPVSHHLREPQESGVTLDVVMWMGHCLNCDFCDSSRLVDAECNTRNGFRLFPDEIP